MMVILTFSEFYIPGFKGGGPIKTVKNLFDQLGDQVNFKLVAGDRDLGDTCPYRSVIIGEWNNVCKVLVFYASSGFLGYKQITAILKESNYDLVYLNSFFSLKFSFFPLLLARLAQKKIVLGPRGEFSAGALSLKRQKKKLFVLLFKLLGLHRGIVFQASSQYEAEDIRKVLGQVVDIQIAEDIGNQEYAKELPVRSNSPLKVVFISRISPKKNLLAALDILKRVRQPIEYDIYGPIEHREYWAQCLAVIETLPPHIIVKYKGELQPEQVVSTLSGYQLFFMPTKGENYGHVIAEAFCAGLPVLIADTTPWRYLQQSGIGWDLSLDAPDQFATTIDQIALVTTDDYQKMRQKVLAWAKNKFSQRHAIDANIAMFRHAYDK